MNIFQKNLIKWCIKSIKDTPDEWKISNYTATHAKKKLSIWYVNGPEFIRIEHAGDIVVGDDGCHMLGWLIPWRRKLFMAVNGVWNRQQKEKTTIATKRATAALQKDLDLG